MKHLIHNIIPLLAAIALSACTAEPLEQQPAAGQLKIVGRITHFQKGNPSTKSVKDEAEARIKNMALFIFDSAGDKVYYELIDGGQPLFLIDRSQPPFSNHTQSLLQKCELYILANIQSADIPALASVQTKAQLMSKDCTIGRVIRESEIDSYGGIPMIGSIDCVESDPSKTIDLRLKENSTLNSSVLEIPLTCLMAKMKFNIYVEPVQKSEIVQRFEVKSWTVENAPSKVLIAQPTGTYESAYADGPFLSSATFSTVDNGSTTVMQGASSPLSFWCYVPEHRVLPTNTSVPYPEGVKEGDITSQNFKPLWLAENDKPLAITLKGIYTDHRNQEKEVTYTVYPGADNYKDFFVNRNHEYVNNITIRGISNSIYGAPNTISVDWRVDVKQNDFKFELERETLLDSHWEIRPVRITLDPEAHPNADRIEVEIMDAASSPWIRMEMPSDSDISSHQSTYCDVTKDELAYGKRRYFTTDLVTGTLSGSRSVTISTSTPSNTSNAYEHVIWMYIDENTELPSVPGSTTRQATIQCRYYESGDPNPAVTENYNFIQKSLHNITQGGRTYGIEYFEEYLYNFDSRDPFTTLPDGMEWGLEKTQLSNTYKSVNYSASGLIGGIIAYIINEAIQKVNLKYDFYLTRDGVQEGLTTRDYQGKAFTKEIVANPNSGIGALATNSDPQSAVEYCLNKNKRNADGTVSQENIKWYLPAIDEIEEICLGGYSDFEVFQDKYYWSSQPAYRIGKMDYVAKITRDEEVFNYYYDDIGYENDPDNKIGRARATKIDSNGQNVKSESHGHASLLRVAGRGSDISNGPDYYYCYRDHNVNANTTYDGCGIFSGSSYTTKNATITWSASTHYYDDGDQPRDATNRVRCVYKAD